MSNLSIWFGMFLLAFFVVLFILGLIAVIGRELEHRRLRIKADANLDRNINKEFLEATRRKRYAESPEAYYRELRNRQSEMLEPEDELEIADRSTWTGNDFIAESYKIMAKNKKSIKPMEDFLGEARNE